MAKIKEECIKEAFDALKHFDKDELEDYVRKVFIRAKDFDPLQGAAAMERAEKEINDERLKEFFSDATQKAKNIMNFEANAKPLREGKVDVRGLLAGRALRSKYLRTTEKDSDWRKRNIADSVKAEYEKIVQRVLGDLSHEETEHFSSGKFDAEICGIIGGKKSTDAFSQKIADKIRDYWEYSKAQLILSGAMKPEEFHPRRFFTQVHDQQRIINGGRSWMKAAISRAKISLTESKAWWRELMKKHIDIKETFKKTSAADLNGDIDQAAIDKIIDKSFDNITTNKSQLFTRSEVVNDRDAVKRKSQLFYIWKSLRNQYEYNKEAGRGNLFAMLMRDAQSASHNIGVAKMWGDNPFSMYLDLKKVQDEVKPEGTFWWHTTDNYFNSVMRLDRTDHSPNATNFFSNLRTFGSMARLPLITLDSISDIGYISAFANRHGVNYFKAWGYHLSHIFNTFPTENRKMVARLMKSQIESHLGYLGRWTETNSVSDWLNKISNGFFKINFLEGFDKGNKTGAMTLVGESIFNQTKKAWKSLPESTQKYLNRFIDDKEWDLLRNKNNGKFFSTDNVDRISDEELRAHYQTTDKSIPLSDMRDDLYRRVYAMFTVAAENSVLAPGDFERVFLFHGTETGTVPGLFWRTVSQFKMYTLAYVDRVLIDGLRNTDGVQQKLIWATTMLMGTLPLAYMGMFFKNAFLGKSMPDPSLMNVPQRTKYLFNLLAPSLGLFSGLLEPKSQNAEDLMWSVLGSPSTRLILNTIASALPLTHGDIKSSGKQLRKAANYFAPLQTAPLISPLINQALGDSSYLEPGQEQYFGR